MNRLQLARTAMCGLALAALAVAATAQGTFVNWESPHVHPLDLTPDGTRLLAVNTPDARLEVFDTTGPVPVIVAEIPVGLDPVSVRAHGNGEAWVCNHVSDSVSIVDLATGRVRATLHTEDEPVDVVFAGSPQRAFVTCCMVGTVEVYDPSDLSVAAVKIPIEGQSPRALAVSPDGSKVYAAIFQSGNRTSILGGGHPGHSYPPQMVNNPLGPWGGANPPPNSGADFVPAIAAGLPTPPRVALIIRQDGTTGAWLDDNGGDWTSFVSGPNAAQSGRLPGWELVDHDVAVIDSSSLQVSYVTHLMNLCMSLAVNPADGRVVVVGTDAINEIRYIENLRGKFVKDYAAVVDPATNVSSRADLNPHLDYQSASVSPELRELSIGDPRAIAFNADGSLGWVAGMGSNNVIEVDGAGVRTSTPPVDVGPGPTGLALDAAGERLFVLNRFDSSVSVIGLSNDVETARVSFFDPEPDAVRNGRPYLYDTHIGSGTGHLACASCHPDATMDRLAWDLGDPQGAMKPVAGNNLKGNMPSMSNAVFEDFHPMKGPMVTQTLQDIIGHEPFHWRGDMAGLEAFATAFSTLQGTDGPLDADDMAEMKAYLSTITFPPNPFRNFDNTLPTSMPLTGHYTTGRFGPPGQPFGNGNAVHGLQLFAPPNFLAGNNACITCHANPLASGTDMTWNSTTLQLDPIPVGPNGEHHLMLVASDGFTDKSVKVPPLRSAYERSGFNTTLLKSTAGFGFEHDGSADSCERHIAQPPFSVASDQDVADILAFILCLSSSGDLPMGSVTDPNMPPGTPGQGTPASVGRQITVASQTPPQADLDLLDVIRGLVNAGKVGLVAHAQVAGESRGYVMTGPDRFDSDRMTEVLDYASLLALAGPGSEVTFTVVPLGTEGRVGVDRDLDGFLDSDEIDTGSDPADAAIIPSQWADLGNALSGTHGPPKILGKGPLVASGTIQFDIAGALENAPLILIAGLSPINVHFKGGTLVPNPTVLVFGLSTNGFGTLEVGGALPDWLPTGLTIVVQGWIVDAAGPNGFAATSGISATAQ